MTESRFTPIGVGMIMGLVGATVGFSIMKPSLCGAPAITPTPVPTSMHTARQDAPRGGSSGKAYTVTLEPCLYEDGNPDGVACAWVDPRTGAMLPVDSSEYRN